MITIQAHRGGKKTEKWWYTFRGDFTNHHWCLPHLFPLIKSFFYIPLLSHLLVKCSHTEAHCSKGPIHEAYRESEGKYKEVCTQWRGLWAQLWPLKDVCVWDAPRHSGPADSNSSSSFPWTWPFTKVIQLPKQPQKDLQLSVANTWET